MPKRKIVHWGFIFFTLTLFTAVVAGNLTGFGVKRALAQTISTDPTLSAGETFVVFGDGERGARRAIGQEEWQLNHFLRRFASAYDRGTVCSLTQQQFSAMSQLYETSVDLLSLDGRDVPVATFAGGLRRHDLQRIIRSSTDGSYCRALQYNRVLYVLMGGGVS